MKVFTWLNGTIIFLAAAVTVLGFGLDHPKQISGVACVHLSLLCAPAMSSPPPKATAATPPPPNPSLMADTLVDDVRAEKNAGRTDAVIRDCRKLLALSGITPHQKAFSFDCLAHAAIVRGDALSASQYAQQALAAEPTNYLARINDLKAACMQALPAQQIAQKAADTDSLRRQRGLSAPLKDTELRHICKNYGLTWHDGP